MVPLWVKIAASNLVNVPEIATLKVTDHILEATYITGITEGYRFSIGGKDYPNDHPVLKDDLIVTGKATLQKQFGGYDFAAQRSLYDYHLRLPRRQMLQWSFIDRRIAIHRFGHILGQGGVHEYPPQELAKMINRIQEADVSKISTPRMTYAYYHRLWMNYFCPNRNVSTRKCVRIIDRLQSRTCRKFVDSSRVLSVALRRQRRLRLCSPTYYIKLFSSLGVERVLDLHPQTGIKAIACAVLGIEYSAPATEEMDNALNRGIVEDFGLKYEPYTTSSSYDLLIADNNFIDYQVAAAKPYAKQAKRLLAYSSGRNKQELLKNNPTIISLGQPGNLLLW